MLSKPMNDAKWCEEAPYFWYTMPSVWKMLPISPCSLATPSINQSQAACACETRLLLSPPHEPSPVISLSHESRPAETLLSDWKPSWLVLLANITNSSDSVCKDCAVCRDYYIAGAGKECSCGLLCLAWMRSWGPCWFFQRWRGDENERGKGGIGAGQPSSPLVSVGWVLSTQLSGASHSRLHSPPLSLTLFPPRRDTELLSQHSACFFPFSCRWLPPPHTYNMLLTCSSATWVAHLTNVFLLLNHAQGFTLVHPHHTALSASGHVFDLQSESGCACPVMTVGVCVETTGLSVQCPQHRGRTRLPNSLWEKKAGKWYVFSPLSVTVSLNNSINKHSQATIREQLCRESKIVVSLNRHDGWKDNLLYISHRS